VLPPGRSQGDKPCRSMRTLLICLQGSLGLVRRLCAASSIARAARSYLDLSTVRMVQCEGAMRLWLTVTCCMTCMQVAGSHVGCCDANAAMFGRVVSASAAAIADGAYRRRMLLLVSLKA